MIGNTPLRGDLQAFCRAQQSVSELSRQQQMRRWRIVLEKRRADDFLIEKVVIVVVKCRKIHINFFAEELPVPRFIPVELFGSKVAIGVEACEVRRAVCQRA